MAASDAHDGEGQDQVPPNPSVHHPKFTLLSWRLHWPIYLASLASLTMLAGFGLMELGSKLKDQPVLITGAAVFLFAFMILASVGALIMGLVAGSLIKRFLRRQKHT